MEGLEAEEERHRAAVDLRAVMRGRFGGWKYEVANMDHSVMQGVEWAERMVLGQEERTYRR